MRPVLTFIRHKGIAGVLKLSHTLYKRSGGKFPKFLFSEHADPQKITTDVKILEQTPTSVTIAKIRPNGTYSNEDFKLLTATDFHLDPGNEEKNNKTIAMFTRWITKEKPDLVILTGDIILSDCQQIDAVQFSQMMESLGVYWCYVFGNHEAREEKEYFKYLLYKGLMYCPHCLNRFGDPSLFGYGNFAVHIKNGERSLLKSLYLFDSGRNITGKYRALYHLPETMNGYDFIKNEQINWYLSQITELQSKYPRVQSLAFLHIPLPEFKEVFNGTEEEGFVPSGKARLLYGAQYESVGCSAFNSGFFEKAVKQGALQGVFAGHDHVNDFCAVYKGVYLIYTQGTGYNTYSMNDKKGWAESECPYGVTVTLLKKDGSILPMQRKNSCFLREYADFT